MPTTSLRHSVPRWLAVTVPLILCGGAFVCVVLYWPWIARPHIGRPTQSLPAEIAPGEGFRTWHEFEVRFIGHHDTDCLARFGLPTERFGGHYGNPSLTEKRTYPEARTWVYAGSGGRLYLSFCQQRGKRVCFSATWLPEGAVF